MKRFKQFTEEAGIYPSAALSSEHIPHDIDDPAVVQKINAILGATATLEYLNPEAAFNQMEAKLSLLGLAMVEGAMDDVEIGENGAIEIPFKRYGDIFGKTVDTPYDEIEVEERIVNLSVRYEKLDTGSYKVYGSLV